MGADFSGRGRGPSVCSGRAESGDERWRRALPGGGDFSGCPPIVHRGSVYVGGLDGVYALAARDGSPRWSRVTAGSVNEAVLGHDGRVFASTGQTLLALDTRGREGWTYTTMMTGFRRPSPRLAAAPSSTRLGCLEALSPSSPVLLETR
ncbi:outer membrane protein assembly factor BamB family protein [Haloferax prahovense]|uniref:outer membrane protein assembly factor BamB family protein n=1 Tax=Haloferax prahovense TaxID=381852 RepID=UPI001EF9FAEB|nr:PQQ-binding-like beta-propeller repeat protein [Haloferax prahovense]